MSTANAHIAYADKMLYKKNACVSVVCVHFVEYIRAFRQNKSHTVEFPAVAALLYINDLVICNMKNVQMSWLKFGLNKFERVFLGIYSRVTN